jgi:cobalt-zinc-cadmium efflux system outer membrane protein
MSLRGPPIAHAIGMRIIGSRSTPSIRPWIILALLSLSQSSGAAVPSAPGDPRAGQEQSEPELRLEDLVRELLRSNPELQAARKRYEAALARPAQESALPDPRVTAGWVSSGWPYPGAGLGAAPMSSIGIQVAQEFPFPGKRALRGGMAAKEAESLAFATRAAELRLVARLKENFHDLRLAYDAADLVRRNQALMGQLAEAAQARYAAGKAAQQDIIKAGTEIFILENRLIALEREKLRLKAEINALLNRPPAAELGRPESVSEVPPLEAEESLEARALESSPLLRAQQAAIDSRRLNLQAAGRAYYPDIDLMAGYYNQGAMNPMWEFKVQVNVPLYFWKKQRYGLEEAGSLLAEASRSYRSAQQQLLLRLRERRLAAEAARRLMELYSRRIVPQAELALESSLAAYRTGAVDFLTVLANFTAILDYQLGYREQLAEYLKALSALEELAGDPGTSDSGATIPKTKEVQP